jgi:uncharacterized protein YxeA
MKKIIIAVIIIVIIAIAWIVFIKKPVFLGEFFFKKTTKESVQSPIINPFSDSYKNPFSNQ